MKRYCPPQIDSYIPESKLSGVKEETFSGNADPSQNSKKLEICSLSRLRMMVIIICLSGFIWHSLEFLMLFLEYPTVVEIKVENKKSMGLPAITVCNDNRISKRAWCKEDPSTCHPGPNETMDDFTDRLEDLYSRLSKESRVRLGIQKRNIILKCDYEGEEEVDCMDNITHLFDFHNGNCFTANALWGEPSKTGFLATHWNPKNSDPCEIKLYINMEANDYTPMDSTVRLNFILHSPYIIPKTNYQAMEFLPGFRYKMRIDKKIFRFLPPPYKTACFDYSSLKEKRMNATMTEEDCFDECFWNSSLHVCGCTNERLGVLLGGKICDENDCLDEVYKRHFNSCFSTCPKACSEENYSITSMDVLPWPTFNHQYEEFPHVHFDNITHARSSLLRLRIWYPRMIETTYSHQPKYEGIELFGALGGYIGLWLGVSLTTLYDIMVPLCARGLRATNNFLFQK